MRSYALALLAASGSAAMPASYNMGKSTAAITLSTTADQYGSIAIGQTLKWAYDAAKVYVTYDAVGSAVTALGSAATEIQTFGVKVKVGSGALNLACSIKQVAAATTTAFWYAQPTTSQVAVSGADCNGVIWSANNCMGIDAGTTAVTAVGATTADGTAQTATAKVEGIYTILGTSTATLDVARKGMTCHMDVEFTGASLTANQLLAVGLNKINTDIVQNFGTTTVGQSTKTFYGSAYFFDYAPTAPTAVPTTGVSKFEAAAGQTVTGLVVAHTVNAWTSTKTVYIDYTWKMTLTDAIVATKVNSATTCSKIATAMWQCAIMETTEVSGNVMMKFKGYRSSAALTFVDGLPEATANLGKVASVWKEYEMTNVAAGTAAATDIVSLPSGQVAGMLQSNQWAWYAKGNQMDAAKKVFDGHCQWFSLETTDAAATAVVAAVTEYAKLAWVGACLSSTCKYGGTALAATAAAAAGAGSLGLASVGAAIVLAMAF